MAIKMSSNLNQNEKNVLKKRFLPKGQQGKNFKCYEMRQLPEVNGVLTVYTRGQ